MVKESEADQILRNKALIIDEIESTVSCSPHTLTDATFSSTLAVTQQHSASVLMTDDYAAALSKQP